MKDIFHHILTYWLLPALLSLPATLPLQANGKRDANGEKQAQALLRQAQASMYSNPKQASYYATQAVAHYPEDLVPNNQRAQAMLLYSQAEQLLGNFDRSIRNLYDTQQYIDPADKGLTGQLYLLMGRVYSKLGDPKKAFELNDRATAIFQALDDSAALASCYNERGVMHCMISEHKLAEQFLQRSLAINRARRDLRGIATNLNNFCLYVGNTEEKLERIREAITINKHLDARWALGENYNNMGRQYYQGKRYNEAIAALEKAYEYAHEIGARELICDNYEYYALVYAATGDYERAYKYLRNMSSLSRELQSSNKLRDIEQEISSQRYQEQKRITDMQEQTYKIELLKRNLWLLGTILGLGLAFSIALYKWYKRRKDLQLVEVRYKLEQSEREVSELKLHQQELELRNMQNALEDSRQEVTNFAVFLRSRNELLDKIRELVKEGYKMDPAALVPHLKKVNAFISQYQSGDKTTSNLLLSIEEKNKEFLAKLLEKHPSLTQGERYLATLLRVNLSTKEISMITGTTPKTINMNRYRLRKSLDLPTETDLVQYLQGI